MPLQFPTNPSLNQIYSTGSASWSWNGTTWVPRPAIVGGTIDNAVIGASAPSTGAFTSLAVESATVGSNYTLDALNSTYRYLVVAGPGNTGIVRFASGLADANGNIVGLTEFHDKNSISGATRVGYIAARLRGTAANNRGAGLAVAVKSDGSSTSTEVIEFLQNGFTANAAPGANGTYDLFSPSGYGTYLRLGPSANAVELVGASSGDFSVTFRDAASNVIYSYRSGSVSDSIIINGGRTGFGINPLSGWRVNSRSSISDSTGGPLLLRNSSDANLFFVRGDGLVNTGTASSSPYNSTTANAANLYVDSGGNLARSTSSRRYKTNILNYTKGVSEVNKLRPVTFKSTDGDEKTYAGLIAEEVHEAGMPEFVVYNDSGEPDAIAYANIVALLIASIKELSTRVAELENK